MTFILAHGTGGAESSGSPVFWIVCGVIAVMVAGAVWLWWE